MKSMAIPFKSILPVAIAMVATSAVLAGQLASQPSDNPAGNVADRNLRQRLVSRQRWQSAGRRIPGANAAALRARAIQQKLQMRKAALNAGVAGEWNSLGPKPFPSDASGTGLQDYGFVTGRATAVAIDPNDLSGNTVFAGGGYGGVWKSTNAGTSGISSSSVTWLPVTDDQVTLAIGSIAVQPQLSNPNAAASVVLAGTGVTDSSADSYYGLGILRSTNGGQTWTLVSQDSAGTHSFGVLVSARSHSAPRTPIWWLRQQVLLRRESSKD
jgi:hypothetical protein